MTIHQLSVFLENKSGTLIQVFKVLKRAHIQMMTGKPAVLESDIVDSEAREVDDNKPDGES